MKFIWLLLSGFLLLGFAENAEPEYHKVPALQGDGVFSLLRRYQLDRYTCNHDEFYRINGMSRKDGLVVGKYYALPVLIYTYNGKTIRSSIGIEDWNIAKSIETYNDLMLEKGYQKESFKTSKELWVPYHLLKCPDPDIPAVDQEAEAPQGEEAANLANEKGGSRRFPIFGKANEYVPLQSTKLRGKIFYVVSGHGGPDPGAQGSKGNHTLCEDEYAYDVALRLARNLVAHGATTYLIVRDPNDGIRSGQYLDCDSDELAWGNKVIPRPQQERLHQRAEIINELYAQYQRQGIKDQYTIIVHVDSRSHRQQTDLFFYYQSTNEKSKQLAMDLQQKMKQKYEQYRSSGQYFGTVTPRDLYMLRETNTPSVYIELGNIRNAFDQQRIIIESNRQALANWLLEGILK
ncbi:MAG: N-acetylmuramoyl-L-alanine amidase [Saprospirales bacterium]|nr:N-acetylmuramoyl-L-alanine amidase [Saprospirales bacterium]MBK8492336.1 N-acetylmuramoyl-L-alanine amidase [Saprospirales bacterium]